MITKKIKKRLDDESLIISGQRKEEEELRGVTWKTTAGTENAVGT